MRKPIIGVPMGDPAGVGAEITVKALADEKLAQQCDVIVVGDKACMEQALKVCKLNSALKVIKDVTEADFAPGVINLVDLHNVDLGKLKMGQVNGMCGQAAFAFIKKSVEMALSHQVDAIATTPINKESLRAGKVNFIGHTEIIGALTGSADPLTMFEVDGMRVFFLTRHMSLMAACQAVTKERVLEYIKRCTKALKQLGVTGKMAVAGLNPHCGEHGLFGWEEVREIEPAVKEAQLLGYNVVGPIGADSIFHQALLGRFQAVLSLYHDQGHIATKTYDFDRTISVTLDMPILRTSVDHGTAFDIAGKGIVNSISMVEAILLAAKYAPNFTHIQ